MFLPWPIHPYYFHADLIWWDGPFKWRIFSVAGEVISVPGGVNSVAGGVIFVAGGIINTEGGSYSVIGGDWYCSYVIYLCA
jgi:hypothetical protein